MGAERSLCVLHTQAEFELGEAAAAFSDASGQHADALRKVHEIEAVNDMSRQELRRLAEASLLNAALHDAVRSMLNAGRARRAAAAESLDKAAKGLDAARVELGRCRQRESDLDRAIAAERRKAGLARQVRDGLIVDELWLQANQGRP